MSGPIPAPQQAGGQPAPDDEAREFAVAFRRFIDWAQRIAAAAESRNEVSALVLDFLSADGADGAEHSVVTRDLAPFEHVNLQAAINAWSARDGRTVEVRGIAMPPHYGGLSLQQLISADGLPPVKLSAPALADLPDGPGSTLGCLRLAVLLVTDARGRYVIMIQGPGEHVPRLQVEVAGLPTAGAQQVLADLDQLRSALNVYRGHLIDVTLNPMGGVSLAFAAPPGLHRDDVVLPGAVLTRIERHALGVAAHREALLAAGQHLKRGLLLYGPPGTGKTHTTRYLLGQMTDYTRLVLTGRALVAIGAVTDLARALLPAVVVLEDVDLVAEDRSLGPSSSPVLFELLDAMDGAAPDADLLFLLTTNRADLLEPALAARPGRVDVAVEVALPDAPARERLLTLYGRDVPLALTAGDIATAIERTDGTTASFLKELIRRAVLEALHEKAPHDDPALTAVTGAHLARALDDLLDTAQGVTRTLLGVGVNPEDLPAGGALAAGLVPARARVMAARYGMVFHRLPGYPARPAAPGVTACGRGAQAWPAPRSERAEQGRDQVGQVVAEVIADDEFIVVGELQAVPVFSRCLAAAQHPDREPRLPVARLVPVLLVLVVFRVVVFAVVVVGQDHLGHQDAPGDAGRPADAGQDLGRVPLGQPVLLDGDESITGCRQDLRGQARLERPERIPAHQGVQPRRLAPSVVAGHVPRGLHHRGGKRVHDHVVPGTRHGLHASADSGCLTSDRQPIMAVSGNGFSVGDVVVLGQEISTRSAATAPSIRCATTGWRRPASAALPSMMRTATSCPASWTPSCPSSRRRSGPV
jgi:hypothetical protein